MAKGRYRQGLARSRRGSAPPPAGLAWPPPPPPEPDSPAGLPPYPEPPRPRLPWWHWGVLAGGALLAVCGVVLAMPVLFVLAMSSNHDEMAEDRSFDTTAVREAAQRGCTAMAQVLDAVPPLRRGEPAFVRAARIRAENEGIEALVDEITALRDGVLDRDPPARAWAADWDRLREAREQYAAALAAGRPAELRVPRDEGGYPVHERMDSVRGRSCDVPPELYVLPEDPSPPAARTS